MKSIALIPHESRTIKHVILMDEVLDISLATKLGLNVHHYQDIITAVKKKKKKNCFTTKKKFNIFLGTSPPT